MRKGLTGKRVVIGGSRKTKEISTLIEKQGGIPVVRSLQGTLFLAEKEVESDLQKFIHEGADWVIFTTGIGTETLVSLAEKLGVKEQFFNIISQAMIASRGYKTISALKKLEVKPVAMDRDGTTKGLIRELENFDFSGKRVMVQLHGEEAPSLIKFLEERGASVLKILPYQHITPKTETIITLCEELFGNKVDAVCFTTAIQVRSLFDFAKEKGFLTHMVNLFHENTLAVAVGKVTAEALAEEGVTRLLVPKNERMGAMIVELSRYYTKQLEVN
ncbi:uroporphyrinogen-III synthase [Metabacillus fastidiosus]|uniref:uroporphyrinogen-III synthase n=1 Tax=Metabacillus fastidiosus TaxID=1458 RepID=UPI003D288247